MKKWWFLCGTLNIGNGDASSALTIRVVASAKS